VAEAPVAIVTGGSSGIGLAVATRLARQGYTLAVIALPDRQLGRAVQSLAAAAPGPHCGFGVDVADADGLAAALRQIAAEVGVASAVFHNAGLDCEGAIDSITVDTWDYVVDVNLRSSYVILRELIPPMRDRGCGSVVLGGSNAGLVARKQDPVYCATKAGIVMLARSVALDVARTGVRVNAVCPGPVRTASLGDEAAALRAVPAGRIAEPEEVAAVVCFLLSDEARFVTGSAYPVDGGKSAGLP
jgi:meso-butanediol dehydrogenase / (S,S)-butanediol dehydrogenase / diacetyl reductase